MRILPVLLLIACSFAAMAQTSLDRAQCSIQAAAAVEGNVWLACEREQLLISRDQGQNWKTVGLPSDAKLRAIEFLDSRRGFVVGDDATMFATGDGGETWNPVEVPATENLNDLCFVGELGWVVGGTGTVLHTADGGKSWTPQSAGTLAIDSVYFTDAEHGWTVGWSGSILRTADGGQTWEEVKVPEAHWSLSSVWFRDTQNGWAVGMLGEILRTTDGGATWEVQSSPVSSWLTAVTFDDAGKGWIATDRDLLVSDDGGQTWQAGGRDEWLFLRAFVHVNGSLWAIGSFGILTQAGPDHDWQKLTTLGAAAGGS